MKLQAVTICINYADYLECIVANRRHFDRWVVVTVARDEATQALCAQHGIEVVVSRTLRADGKDFNAAHNKSRALNEGLDALDQEGWAVILDSDVLLPRHFRARVEALPLEEGCLYGVAGRKICEDREMFEMLRECEPWDRFCDRHSQTIGYFNLFHLEGPVNRYVERTTPAGGAHDDWMFTTSFPEQCRRQLPMRVIHTGPPGANWSGRVAGSYHADGVAVAGTGLPPEIAGKGRVAVIGYFPGNRWRDVARRFGEALLIDHFQVHHPSASPMIEADRAVLRGLWERESVDDEYAKLLGTHGARTLAGIEEASLDALYLPGEATPDWLTAAVPHWMRKLKDGAIICGDLYGLPHWPDSTYAIALLLGVPVEVSANGFWWGRKRSGLVRAPGVSEAGEREVILVNEGTADLERLLVTMHQVRQGWNGRMRLFHWGPENQGLRIAAARHGVEMIGVEPTWPETSGVIAETLDAGFWPDAIYLPSGALVLGKVEDLFSSPLKASEFNPGKPWRMEGATKGGAADCHASNFEETAAVSPSVLLCTGTVETWTDAAWARWSGALTAMTTELAAEIRVAVDATVVMLFGAREIDEFEQVWLTLKFAPAVPVVIGLIGIAGEDVWLAPTGREPQIVTLSAEDSPRRQLAAVLAAVQTERVILLPPDARPLPGAELFPGEEGEAISDAQPAAESSWFGIFRTETLRRICAEDSGWAAELPGRRVDLERKGWLRGKPSAHSASRQPPKAAAFPL